MATEDQPRNPHEATRELVAIMTPSLNKLALIPSEPVEDVLAALDHSSMIRETLKDYLEFDIETLGTGISDTIKQGYSQRIDEINRAEEEIMKVQAGNMIDFDASQKNTLLYAPAEEKLDLSEETAKKFNLIRFQDVRKSYANLIHYDSVDDNHIRCPLYEMDGIGPHRTKSIFMGDDDPGARKTTKKIAPKSTKTGGRKRSTEHELAMRKVSKEECTPRHMKGFYDIGITPLHNKWDDVVGDKLIFWYPKTVTFEAFKVGKAYLKEVTLTNIANRMAKFEIRLHKSVLKTFDVVFSKPMLRHFSLAPGMQMKFLVKFQCVDFDDYATWLDIDVVDGQSVRIDVTTKRPAPTLISHKFFLPSKMGTPEFKKSSAITVDCGTRFLGTITRVSASLMNVGSEATYYITSEENWEAATKPSEVLKDNTVSLPAFDVSPALFRLDAGCKMLLNVTFTPKCEGVHLEKLMILCDNFVFRSIDLIGEAALFDPSHFCINAGSKNFDVEEEDYYGSIQCIDFGTLRQYSSVTRKIHLKSESPAELEFQWELRTLPNWPEGFDIKSNQLTLSPTVGMLCSFKTEEMEITCVTGGRTSGVYKSLLCFVAKNVPTNSLKSSDIPGQRRQTESTLMIDLMFLELRVSVVELYIELDPPLLVFREELHGYERYRICARNTCPWEVDVIWNFPDEPYVTYDIDPPRTLISPNGKATFSMLLSALQVGRFENLLILECPNDNVCFNILVRGEVTNAELPRNTYLTHDIGPHVSGRSINFAIPLQFNETIKEYSLSCTEVDAFLDLPSKIGDELNYVSLDSTNFQDPDNDCPARLRPEVSYHTTFNSVEGTDLRLTTARLKAAGHEFYVDTIGLVQDVDVVLERDEILLGVDFYQRVPIKFKVTMINNNQACVDFNWLAPTGSEAHRFGVEHNPKRGRLDRLGKQVVEISLTVDRPGRLEGLELPCALEGNSKALVLNVRGYAQDVVFRMSYPCKNETIRVTWPRVPSQLLTVSEDLDIKDEKCCICFISKFDEVEADEDLDVRSRHVPDAKYIKYTTVPLSWGEVCEPRNLLFTDSTVSLPPYENWPLIGGMYYADKFHDRTLRSGVPDTGEHTFVPIYRLTYHPLLYRGGKINSESNLVNASMPEGELEFFHNWEPEDLKRRMVTISVEEKSQVVTAFAEHALVFHINTYHPNNTLTIKLENLTPIGTSYEAEVQEFVECDQETIFKDMKNCAPFYKSNESLIKMLGGDQKDQIDGLCKKIQPKAGLVLSVQNTKGDLRLNESVEIHITAFAICWGIYFDHIVIRVPELPPAIIPVLVIVEGPPVWFTMAPPVNFKPVKQDPTIRFPEVLSRSSSEQKVFVYNDSFLPVKLVWTTYLQQRNSKSTSHLLLPDEPPDFSINLELHPTLSSNFCLLNLTDGYGDIDSSCYDVEPRVMYLKPKKKSPLYVRLNTADVWFGLDHLVNKLRGAALAYIYVDDDENDSEHGTNGQVDGGFSVYRPDGPKLEPLVLRMEANLEIAPMRTLNCENTVFVYKVRSYDVVSCDNKVYEERRCYLFQNASSSIAEVQFNTTGNLLIDSVSVNGESCNDEGSGVKVVVRPDDVVELKTVLRLSEGDLRQLTGKLQERSRKFADEREYPLTTILITHRDSIQQVIPIHINVENAKLEISVTSLDFGEVFLHSSKVLPVRLHSKGGEEDFTCKIVSGYKGILKVSPVSGHVTSKKSVSLDVVFTPQECLKYYALLLVTPSSAVLSKVVLIFGEGTWNYKYHELVSP